MKLYIETKLMTLEDGEHELILRVNEEGYWKGILKGIKKGRGYVEKDIKRGLQGEKDTVRFAVFYKGRLNLL